MCFYLELAITTQYGAIAGKMQVQQVKFYNLDAIISVGYQVNSHSATMFRRWATQVLKEYALHGYAVNQRFERLEYRMTETEKQIYFIVKTLLPPREGIFYNGQIFDACKFVSNSLHYDFYKIYMIPLNYPVNHKNQGSDNIGASLKDLGKKLFAFSKMEMKAAELLRNIP